MIGFLQGRLSFKQPPRLMLDVHGVGYELEAPMSTFYQLPDLGHELKLLTHLIVREDAHNLYGFATEAERQLFRNLIKVSGVGARIALAILSGITVDEFSRCVQHDDAAKLVRVPGIGKKTAERLIVEMRDRIAAAGTSRSDATPGADTPEREAFGALIALGYKAAEASQMLKSVSADGLSTEEIIRRALKAAAK
ncbi:Holliday junction branch migration protein RuvA [soil metagenome]